MPLPDDAVETCALDDCSFAVCMVMSRRFGGLEPLGIHSMDYKVDFWYKIDTTVSAQLS